MCPSSGLWGVSFDFNVSYRVAKESKVGGIWAGLFQEQISCQLVDVTKPWRATPGHEHRFKGSFPCMYVSFIGLRLTKTSLTLINRTRLRTKGQSAGYPQVQIGITSNSFQHLAP